MKEALALQLREEGDEEEKEQVEDEVNDDNFEDGEKPIN